jgi:glycosidase
MFRAFDMEYDYDIREVFDRYLKGEGHLSNYIDLLNFQECLYPEDHIKMRCLENHDQPRICSFVKDHKALMNFTAFLYFLKGSTLIYAGQEYKNTHVPSLFDKDLIERSREGDISEYLRQLNCIKKGLLSCSDYFKAAADDENDIAILERDDNRTRKLGIFSLKGKAADVNVTFPDGTYINRLSGAAVEIKNGILRCEGNPIILVNDGV